MAAPNSMEMNRTGGSTSFLDKHSNLFVKQTRKGCFQEMLGCEANTEFLISTMENTSNFLYYAIEDTSCCIRFFCPALRPFTITVSDGGAPGGSPLTYNERFFRCPAGNCKCCCYQEIQVRDGANAPVGAIVEDMWFCVPMFKVNDASGNHQYNLHQPTCCGGMCVDCCAEGCCNCRIPFYVFEPGKQATGEQCGSITKIWSGLGTELFTDADKFEMHFPPGADSNTKATLLGGTFLLNQLLFRIDLND